MNDFEKGTRDGSGGPWDVLKGMSFRESNEELPVAGERLSKKPLDIFVRRVFELNPELKNETSNMLEAYSAQNKKLPFLHITPDAIEYEDGGCVSTGNVNGIKSNGFLPGDSNVGGFVAAGRHYDTVGDSESFKTSEAFLKSYVVLLQHYLHHALRLNHRNSEVLDGKKIKSVKPAIVLVRGDLKVDHGTDYEDHFILRNGSSPDDVVGIMNVDSEIDLNDPDSIAKSYNGLIKLLMSDFE